MDENEEKTEENAEAPAETTEETPPDPKNLIAEGKSMFEAFKSGDRFKFLSAKLKEKHDKDLLAEILK